MDDIRFFLGYAGWSSGQLAEEVDQGGWILAESTTDMVFDTAESAVWGQTLRSMGGSFAILANFPDHPSLN
jgi:putative transcriptional regulator